jgi:hypothetical protein
MPIEPPRAGEAFPGPVPVPQPEYRWYHKMSALLFIVFCLELGVFLAVVPWTEVWDRNFFIGVVPEWRAWWTNPYVRGAVSGVGVLNLYISLLEIFRLRRFAQSSGR